MKKFKVYLRNGDVVDVTGASHIITKPDYVLDATAHPSLLTRPTLEIRNKADGVAAVFPEDAWHGLTITDHPDIIIGGADADVLADQLRAQGYEVSTLPQ